MGNKIFISYKYADYKVQQIQKAGLGILSTHSSGLRGLLDMTTVRDYVTETQNLLSNDHINKGEKDSESLAQFKNSTIASKLRDKIWDSSVTIVMISKGMKEYGSDRDQWIPWEIAYSLKEHYRGDRVSRSNALLAVVLPDENGSYEYFINEHYCSACNSTIYNTNTLFDILRRNMFNVKSRVAEYSTCDKTHDYTIYTGEASYIKPVKWSDFKNNHDWYINKAIEINKNISDYEIVKEI